MAGGAFSGGKEGKDSALKKKEKILDRFALCGLQTFWNRFVPHESFEGKIQETIEKKGPEICQKSRSS
jgi:hypothetical protein